jgi:hypothetical protein
MDEARFSLKVTHRRLWCPFGSRPPWTHDHQCHWFWLYAAVEPVSGTCFVLFLPHVDEVCFKRFLEELRRHTGTDRIGLVLDNSGSHISGKVRWPDGMRTWRICPSRFPKKAKIEHSPGIPSDFATRWLPHHGQETLVHKQSMDDRTTPITWR